jgi:hypothetical protein
VIQDIVQTCSRVYEYYFNFATHSYFGTISKDVLTINVSRSVNIKYKSYFKISIIENAICLPAKRLINLERFPLLSGCGHSFHIECILPNISDCSVCQATTLADVEALGKTANINAVCSGDSL